MKPKLQFTTDGGQLGPPAPGVAEPPVGTIMVVKSVGGWSLTLSYWLLVSIFAVLPAVWALRFWRCWVRGLRAGRCRTCRYDLTGNTSGVCPECGTTVARKAWT